MFSRLTGVARSFTSSSFAAMSTKPLLLYYAGTPNGKQPIVLLEELKAAYGQIDYE
jgi:hypothetical protein